LIDSARQPLRRPNITHPCKQAVLPLLTELSEDARAIGAVNTMVFRKGGRKGFNTDCSGSPCPSTELGDAARRRVVLLGAGGAGAAIAHRRDGLEWSSYSSSTGTASAPIAPAQSRWKPPRPDGCVSRRARIPAKSATA